MAEPTTPAASPAAASSEPSLVARILTPLNIVMLLNTVAAIGTLGFLFYSKFHYKRPAITETKERNRLYDLYSAPKSDPVPVFIEFGPLTVNSSSNPQKPEEAPGTYTQLKGKLHYVTIGFSVRLRDNTQQYLVESARPSILDYTIHLLGEKQFHELTSVQGRYILRSQIIAHINEVSKPPKAEGGSEGANALPVVSHLYFTKFLVQ